MRSNQIDLKCTTTQACRATISLCFLYRQPGMSHHVLFLTIRLIGLMGRILIDWIRKNNIKLNKQPVPGHAGLV